jgi:hypothetical protein
MKGFSGMDNIISNSEKRFLEFLRNIPETAEGEYNLKNNHDIYLGECLYFLAMNYHHKWENNPSRINEELSERLWHLTSQLRQEDNKNKKNLTLRRNRIIAQLIDILVLFDCPKNKATEAIASKLCMGLHLVEQIRKNHCKVRKQSKSQIDNIELLRHQILDWSPRLFMELKHNLQIKNFAFDEEFTEANQAIHNLKKFIEKRNPYEANIFESILG